MKLGLFQFFTLLLLALTAGVFWGTWFTLTRSLETFSAAEFIHIGKTIIANVAVPMRIIMPAAILLLLISLWLYPNKRSTGFYWGLAAFLFLIITLLITVGIEVPIDNQIKQWQSAAMPSDWEATRSRWNYFHAWRTLTALMSLACFLIPVIFFKPLSDKTRSGHTRV
jgi:uncharacterized membrane protein